MRGGQGESICCSCYGVFVPKRDCSFSGDFNKNHGAHSQRTRRWKLYLPVLANFRTPAANGSHSLGVDPATISFRNTDQSCQHEHWVQKRPRRLAPCHPTARLVFFFENWPITCTFFCCVRGSLTCCTFWRLLSQSKRRSFVLIASDLWALLCASFLCLEAQLTCAFRQDLSLTGVHSPGSSVRGARKLRSRPMHPPLRGPCSMR